MAIVLLMLGTAVIVERIVFGTVLHVACVSMEDVSSPEVWQLLRCLVDDYFRCLIFNLSGPMELLFFHVLLPLDLFVVSVMLSDLFYV